MKANGINCFDSPKARKKDLGLKTTNDQALPRFLKVDAKNGLWNQELVSFALPQRDLVKLRIFSSIHDLTPEEVLATALREYFTNNGPDNMKNVFKNLDDKFSLISEAN